MKSIYDTPELKDIVSASTLNEFIGFFKYVSRFTQSEIDESNLVFQTANKPTD